MDSACPKELATKTSSDSDHSTKVAPTTLIYYVAMECLRPSANTVIHFLRYESMPFFWGTSNKTSTSNFVKNKKSMPNTILKKCKQENLGIS